MPDAGTLDGTEETPLVQAGANVKATLAVQAAYARVRGSGSPIGVVTPGFLGQFYSDTTTPALWEATGATNADWFQWI